MQMWRNVASSHCSKQVHSTTLKTFYVVVFHSQPPFAFIESIIYFIKHDNAMRCILFDMQPSTASCLAFRGLQYTGFFIQNLLCMLNNYWNIFRILALWRHLRCAFVEESQSEGRAIVRRRNWPYSKTFSWTRIWRYAKSTNKFFCVHIKRF